MPASMEQPSIRVEGRDDQYALLNLLIRHGIDYDNKPLPPNYPKFEPSGSVEAMLAEMETAVQLSSGKAIGFVLDADSPLASRWRAARDRLRNVGVDVPKQPPPEGFIGNSADYKATVGLWLMPDNEHDGKLETFLHNLIEKDDPLIAHAGNSTDVAVKLGAKFPDVGRIKAVIHAWLAWQKEPGLPYGTAIRAEYFGHDSPTARAFVSWFKNLYGIP